MPGGAVPVPVASDQNDPSGRCEAPAGPVGRPAGALIYAARGARDTLADSHHPVLAGIIAYLQTVEIHPCPDRPARVPGARPLEFVLTR